MKKAVIYARYSSDLQRGESIDAQVRACKYFAQRYGYEVEKVYADRAESGRTTANRAQWMSMMEDASRREFEVILVHKLNRFSRSGLDTLNYKGQLAQYGVELVSVTERLDDSPEGRLMLYVIAGMNEFYSANLATEVMKGLKENAYKGKSTGGRPPLGYDLDPETKKLVINEFEAQAVRIIFDMYAGGFGYGAIIDRLNREGYRTKRGGQFGKNSLYDILKNEKYIGVYTFDKSTPKGKGPRSDRHKYKTEYIRAEGQCPAIVDRDVFEFVQKAMEANRHMTAKGKATTNYLLTGKLICGECGHKMVGEKRGYDGRTYFYYVCNAAKRKGTCTKAAVRKELVEEMVLDALNQMAFSQQSVDAMAEAAFSSYSDDQQGATARALDQQLVETEKNISNLVRAIMKGIDDPAVQDELQKQRLRKDTLQVQRAALEDIPDQRMDLEQLKDYFKNFLDIKNLSEEAQKSVIQRYVDRVYLYDLPHTPDDPKGKQYEIKLVLNPNQEDLTGLIDFKDMRGSSLSPPRKTRLNNVFRRVLFLFTITRIITHYDGIFYPNYTGKTTEKRAVEPSFQGTGGRLCCSRLVHSIFGVLSFHLPRGLRS